MDLFQERSHKVPTPLKIHPHFQQPLLKMRLNSGRLQLFEKERIFLVAPKPAFPGDAKRQGCGKYKVYSEIKRKIVSDLKRGSMKKTIIRYSGVNRNKEKEILSTQYMGL